MITRELKLGILFAILANIIGGFQPVWANLRPAELNAHLFSGMSSLFQAVIIIPMFLVDYFFIKRKRLAGPRVINPSHRLYFGKSKWGLFLVVGSIFSVVLFLYYEGLYVAGSINGTLALKTTAVFALLFGFLLLKEKISLLQIVFAGLLFFGMTLAITQGDFTVLDLNSGVIIILVCAAIWTFGHACSRSYLASGITSSSELVLMRNIISAIILLVSYWIMCGGQINLIFNSQYAVYYILMGLIYGTNLFCWYKMLEYLDISMASIFVTPQLIVTAYFGSILLGEAFTEYHLIGLMIIIVSIVVMNYRAFLKPSDS